MKTKQYAVIGLGVFGASLAKSLAESNCEVIAIDRDSIKVEEVADYVTLAVTADVTEPGVMKNLGISKMDAVIIAIGRDMEASVLATVLAKEEGVPVVLNKAVSEIHAKILKKVGSDRVVFPEKDMGVDVAKRLISSHLVELFEISPDYSMIEVKLPKIWIGKNLYDLNIRKEFHVNVIGLKRQEVLKLNLSARENFEEEDILIMIGENHRLDKILQLG